MKSKASARCFDRPELAAVTEQLRTASPMKLTAFPEVHDLFENAVERVLRNDEPAAAVMAETQQRAQALMPR